MKKLRSSTRPNQVFIAIVIVLFFIITLFCYFTIFAQPQLLSPTYNAQISQEVCNFLSSSTPITNQSESTDNLLFSSPDNYCLALTYDYTEEYIYAYIISQDYSWFYHYNPVYDAKNTIEVSRSLHQGANWSSHVRLSYTSSPDFRITGYTKPHDGITYYEELTELFAPIGIVDAIDTNRQAEIHNHLTTAFYNEHGNDPYPEHIETIYGMTNPKIIVNSSSDQNP